MAIAKCKFNPETPKKANRFFVFFAKAYQVGDNFDPVESGASLRQVRGLYNSRYIIDALVEESKGLIKPIKLTEAQIFEAAKADLATEIAMKAAMHDRPIPTYYMSVIQSEPKKGTKKATEKASKVSAATKKPWEL